MKVAMLGLYPVRPDWILGGEEAVIAMLSRQLNMDPHIDLHVVTYRGGDGSESIEETPGAPPVRRLKQPRFGRLTWHRTEIAHLQRVLDALRPDVVHAHGSLVYAAAATRCGFPAVVTVHGIMAREATTLQDPRKRLARAMDSWFERQVLRRVENLIAISPYVLESMPQLRPAKVRHIENPVDDRYFDVTRHEEALRIFCPLRVIPRKGLLFALEALPQLLEQFPNMELRIAGETLAMPSYLAACQSYISAHDLGRHVRFLDNLSMPQLADEYARCTLMLLPSVQETAPVVIAEAMAAGVPVVATRVGGAPHMVQDGVTGLLVDYGEVNDLLGALSFLLNDAPLRRLMGERSRAQAAQRFRLSAVAERTRQVYEQVREDVRSGQTRRPKAWASL